MIQFKVYNDDKLRSWNYFPTLKDPNVLENTLLRIINEIRGFYGIPEERFWDISYPEIANMYFPYFTSSNFHSWGELPLYYIYNDMIRHIQNRNTGSNFIMTLESIFISFDEVTDTASGEVKSYYIYDVVNAYVSENYLNSYNYIINHNNGVMIAYVPKSNGILAYIIAVGFNPDNMCRWFCTSTDPNSMDSLPYTRYMSFRSIVNTKLSFANIKSGFVQSAKNYNNIDIQVEYSDNKMKKDYNECLKILPSVSIKVMTRKSRNDTEVKYGNYPTDYNFLEMYDKCIPCLYMEYNNGSFTQNINVFNQYGDFKDDYRLLETQNEMIKIHERKSGKKN